ncbi:MAG: crossover junction endodeoxyribonuclease RuvC [Planctomycetota bacterium]|nr:crossover junction endodeoxyribonuclease RuvC [Planctomycetota bacterium]
MREESPVSAPGARDGERAVPEDFPWPIVLGVDPGTRVVGYGALVDAPDGPRLLAAGEVRTGPGSVPERLAAVAGEVDELLRRLRPTVVVVEQAFAARNIQSALRIGEGRGVILAAAARSGAQVVQYAPASARKSLLGHGGADKTQVARMVAVSLGLDEPPGSLDTTDALALALAYLHRSRFPGPTA